MSADNGGPAFPRVVHEGDSHDNGMTLRDYFAAKALQGFISQSHAGPKDWTHMGHGWGEDCANQMNRHSYALAQTLADFSYKLADAMIQARSA